MDVKKLLTGSKDFLIDATIVAIEKHCDEEIDRAKEHQRDNDIFKAACAFVELKQSDSSIYGLLNDYFGVEDISEAREYVKKARIHTQIVNLRVYCTENGMTNSEFRQYATDHSLEAKLKVTSKLLEMSPEKLKAYLDKK